jgi:hypothetical protein
LNRTDPTGLYWFQQPWQAPNPVVGRDGSSIPPGGGISNFIERNIPAGRTLGEVHDALVDTLTKLGVPDIVANVPTMPGAYMAGVGLEILRGWGFVPQPTQPLMCPKK